MGITAIAGATLIDGTGRPPIADALLLVEGERVLAVGRRSDGIPDGATVVEAPGATIIPGLIDAHTHVGVVADNSFLQVDDPRALATHFLAQYIRWGITTIRDTGNFDPAGVLAWLRVDGPDRPRFFGAGPILDGPADPPAPWRWLRVVDDEEAARREAADIIASGVDFLKIYVWAKPHVIRAIVREAHQQGVHVTAHVGHVVTVEEAIRLGVDSLEHVRIGRELVAEKDRPALDALGLRVLDPLVSWRPWRFIDPEGALADGLISLMIERDVAITPTLTLSRAILRGRDPEVTQPDGIELLPQAVRDQWNQFAYPFDYSDEDWANAEVELERQVRFIGRAQLAGVRVVAGTDTTNPFVVPGTSLHDELGLLVEAGVSPLDAIAAASGRGAELLGRADQLGTLRKRRFADFVILDADPLADIANTRLIREVWKSGSRVWAADADRSA